MTDKQAALDALDSLIVSLDMSHTAWCDEASWRDTFKENVETIRQALTAPAVDVGGIEELENDLKCLSGYCPDHFDESPNCQQECAMFVREHMTTIFDLIAPRGLIGNAPHPGVKRLADFILKLDMGHPRASDQKPDGEDVYEAAIAIITKLINKQNTPGTSDAAPVAVRTQAGAPAEPADAQERGDELKCPRCGGEADNGHDRCHPPNAYNCTKCDESVCTCRKCRQGLTDQCIKLGYDG